ncbi:hypothetical protein [Noviherbaspirillum aridicola]|nr:hypothetical protein [Noviherbaspirillum aridicola]
MNIERGVRLAQATRPMETSAFLLLGDHHGAPKPGLFSLEIVALKKGQPD